MQCQITSPINTLFIATMKYPRQITLEIEQLYLMHGFEHSNLKYGHPIGTASVKEGCQVAIVKQIKVAESLTPGVIQ